MPERREGVRCGLDWGRKGASSGGEGQRGGPAAGGELESERGCGCSSEPRRRVTVRVQERGWEGSVLGASRLAAPPFPDAQHIHSRSTLECAYRTHLVAGIGFYQHLLLYIQSHYQLELQCCIDWTHVTDPLIGQ